MVVHVSAHNKGILSTVLNTASYPIYVEFEDQETETLASQFFLPPIINNWPEKKACSLHRPYPRSRAVSLKPVSKIQCPPREKSVSPHPM